MATRVINETYPTIANTPATVTGHHMDDGHALFRTVNGYEVTIAILLASIVLSLVAILAIFLNSVVIRAIHCRGDARTPSDNLLFGLAIADILTGIVQLYYGAYNVAHFQIFEECLVRNGLIHTTFLSSILHLTMLTFDCYFKMCFPLVYLRRFQKRTTRVISLGICFVSVLVGMAPVFGWNSGRPAGVMQCTYFGVLARSYRLVLLIVLYGTFITMICMYIHIYLIARKESSTNVAGAIGTSSQRNTPESGTESNPPSLRRMSAISAHLPSRRSWRFIKTVSIIIGFYAFCWLPGGIFISIELGHHLDAYTLDERGTILLYLCICPYLNAVVNPTIYAVRIPYIRAKFKSICACVICRIRQ